MADRILKDASPLADVEDVLNSIGPDDAPNNKISLDEYLCSDTEEDDLDLLKTDEPLETDTASVAKITGEIKQMLNEADVEGLLPRECDGFRSSNRTRSKVSNKPILINGGMPVFLDESFFKLKEGPPVSTNTGLNNLDDPKKDMFPTLFSHDRPHKSRTQQIEAPLETVGFSSRLKHNESKIISKGCHSKDVQVLPANPPTSPTPHIPPISTDYYTPKEIYFIKRAK